MFSSIFKKIQNHQENVSKMIEENEQRKQQNNATEEAVKPTEIEQSIVVDTVPQPEGETKEESVQVSTFNWTAFGKLLIWLTFLGYMAWSQWGKDFFGLPKCDSKQTVEMVTKMNAEIYAGKFDILGLTYISEIGYQQEKNMRFCQAQVEMHSIPDKFPFPTAIKYVIDEQNGKYQVRLLPF
ncbi:MULTISPECIES: hypothetical protein [Glaesserella]|nr:MULTISPECIES: hypothetical protein [Glaesserella]AUI66682.1 hypothetical protein CJD39_08885 [Glaesserella sp. 15-184]